MKQMADSEDDPTALKQAVTKIKTLSGKGVIEEELAFIREAKQESSVGKKQWNKLLKSKGVKV